MEEKVWEWSSIEDAKMNEDDIRITRHGFTVAKTIDSDSAQRLCNMLNFAEENMSEDEIKNGCRRSSIDKEVAE